MKGFLSSSLVILFFLTFYSVGEPAQRQRPGADTKASAKEAIGKGDARGALGAAESRATEAEKNGAWQQAAQSYVQASIAARISGQVQKAVTYGNKAFEMGEKGKLPAIQVQAVLQLFVALRNVGQHAKAREWLYKGFEITKQIDAPPARQNLEANLYRELGMDFLRSGEIQKAIENVSYSLQVRESQLSFLKKRPGRNPVIQQRIQRLTNVTVVTLNTLGNVYQRAGNTTEAIKVYERALGIIKEFGLKTPVESTLYHGLGRLYLEQKEFPHALENLQKALEIAERLQHASVIQQASSQIANLFLQTKKPSEAIAYYRKAIDSIESTRSLLESEEFRSSFFEDKRQIYAGIILAHLQTRNPAEAFNYNERARSRAFLDILGSKVQLAKGNLLEEERALQARISTLQARIGAQKEEDEGEEEEENVSRRPVLRQELEEAQKAYGEFLAKVRKENKEQASLMSVEPLTLKELQELLDPGVSVLEYFVVRQAVLLWVVEKERLRFVRIPIERTELVKKVSALRDAIYQVGEKEKFQSHAQELYKLLIEPALADIRGKELLIIPHDVLHYLPYQALVSDKGRYLIQDYPIYYLSSASLMQFTREKRRASKGQEERALVMGNPSLGDQAFNLRFAEREAKEIARVYPKSAVYLKTEATKPKAVSLSPDYDILHFAVHGEFDQDDPLSSGLLLAAGGKGEGKLKASEIFSLNLKADMVVLSACETGLGKITNGDEIIGLTRAFIYAGAPSVVTTLWKVNDRASYELVQEFYTNLKTKKKSEALRQAQLKIMKEFPHPFFWAAYELNGER
ncbi:MAG: hypothetical protein A2W66_02460 [Deltaproteobacteria bacterium RIFCSPLOWO2_02_56_12]|nr:MAG: hypothetical protein A2W66_02460 [Deltaproteobacteria bacterium RIFCSPLOWO2_02_56_12]